MLRLCVTSVAVRFVPDRIEGDTERLFPQQVQNDAPALGCRHRFRSPAGVSGLRAASGGQSIQWKRDRVPFYLCLCLCLFWPALLFLPKKPHCTRCNSERWA